MATYSRSIRRGLPRVAGGDAWPAGGDAPVGAEAPGVEAPVAEAVGAAPVTAAEPAAATAAAVAEPVVAGAAEAPGAEAVAAAPAETAPADATVPVASNAPVAAAAAAGGAALRRGLPRTPGGEPWPPAGAAPAGAAVTVPAVVAEAAAPAVAVPAEAPAPAEVLAPAASAPAAPAPATSAPAPASIAPAAPAAAGDAVTLRRGLPRVAGGDGWPPAGSVARPVAAEATPAAGAPVADATTPAPATSAPAGVEVPAAVVVPAKGYDVSTPLPFKQTVFPGKYANVPVVKRESKRYGKFTAAQWFGIVVLAGGALLGAAAMAVIMVRLLLSLPFMEDFLTAFPGEYDLPAGSQPGFPAWAQWQHYFNMFLMLLIIRTGWSVRTDRRPSAFWTPKRSADGKGKISLTLWLHQSLDLLWVTNGIVFVVLLFVSGHWVRIVPTSWEVFPNALSAILQYVSLDWPTEHGWVNYNSIQQLMYFTVVFIAAPVAIITGVRMSNLWPKKAEKLNKLYPVEVARALHLPTMLFFVLFIIIHVFLVFATGALRNLNHMFGGTDEISWTGFWLFFAGLCVMVGAWFAARPLVIAPIAKVFGKVSAR